MVSINHPSADIDDGWQLEVGTTVTFLCAFIVVTIRTFARFKYARIGWDDWIMLFALVRHIFQIQELNIASDASSRFKLW